MSSVGLLGGRGQAGCGAVDFRLRIEDTDLERATLPTVETMAPMPADYDGDGLADVAMCHAPSGTWYVRDSFTGADRSFPLGGPGQLPAHRIPLLHSWYDLPWAP